MGFPSGSISFRRYAVCGEQPAEIDQDVLNRLYASRFQPTELGTPAEVEYGWSGGSHVLDTEFSFERNVYSDCLHFALRVDTNKVPGELVRAYRAEEERKLAAGNPSGHISKAQKVQAKETVRQRVEEELKTGKHRRSKLVPLLWDFNGHTLYTPASGAAYERLAEIFDRTFRLALEPLTAGTLAQRVCEARADRGSYEDARPTQFVPGPDGMKQLPEYPWVGRGVQPKDFFGNEFLLWLWHELGTGQGVIRTGTAGEVAAYIDRTLDLDCAYGQTGKDGIKGDAPDRTPEAMEGLRVGKLPRKLGLVLEVGGSQYTLTLNGELLSVSGMKLPDVEEPESHRSAFEQRIDLIRQFCRGLDGVYARFVGERMLLNWTETTNAIRRWIMINTSRRQTAA